MCLQIYALHSLNAIVVAKKPPAPLKRQTGGLKLKIGESIDDQDETTQEAIPEAEIKVENDSYVSRCM